MQFKPAFTFVDAIMGEAGGSHYESAGALGRGNKFWALARVPKADFCITGTEDMHQLYLLFVSSHDGSVSTSCFLTDRRVVCENILNQAMRDSGGNMFKIKHTTNGEKRLNAAKSIISGAVDDARDLEYKLNLLAMRKMTKDSFATVVDRLFPGKEDSARHERTVQRISKLFEENDNNAIPQIEGSAYTLLNSITNFTDHERGIRITKEKKYRGMTDSMLRAESAVFGSGNDLKSFALSVILEETKNNPPLIIAA